MPGSFDGSDEKQKGRRRTGNASRMDPSTANRQYEVQSPFTGMFDGQAPGSPGGGGGLPFLSRSTGPNSVSINALNGASGTAGAGSMAGTGMSTMELLKLFGVQTGMNILGGLFGGDDGGQQERESFADYDDPRLNPADNLSFLNEAFRRMGSGLTDFAQQPIDLSRSVVQDIQPINVPGIPFQIGGGFGSDPALGKPELAQLGGMNLFDPFQGYGPNAHAGGQGESPVPPPGGSQVRRRTPQGGQ